MPKYVTLSLFGVNRETLPSRQLYGTTFSEAIQNAII